MLKILQGVGLFYTYIFIHQMMVATKKEEKNLTKLNYNE